MPSERAIQEVWMLSLVIYGVVVVVVAVLLTLILATAVRIRDGAAAIWTVGQKVANNTIHIALLVSTNYLVGRILDGAVTTLGAVTAIGQHACECARCPDCVTGRSSKGV